MSALSDAETIEALTAKCALLAASLAQAEAEGHEGNRQANDAAPVSQPGSMTMTLADMGLINPLITSSGDTFRVSSALTALADLVAGEQTMEPDSDQPIGLSFILVTCSAALRRMQEMTGCKARTEEIRGAA